MSSHPVTIPVPEHVYDRARRIAEETSQPVEKILAQHLEESFAAPLPVLPPDEQAELDALAQLSDDALWTIAREQMPADLQTRMQGLMDRNSKGALSQSEQRELEELVERGQRLTLRKAEAAALLTRRGHKVTPQSMAGPSD